MLRLTLMFHGMIGTTLAGVGVVIALVSGVSALWPLIGAAVAGYLLGLPLAALLAHRLSRGEG